MEKFSSLLNVKQISFLVFKLLFYPVVGGWVVRRCHVSFVTWGVQLILADSWARPAILVAGKGREVMFLAHLSSAQDELL